MKDSIIFAVYGCSYVPKNWALRFSLGKINRLYYIHSGNGGFILHGKRFPFEKGKIYVIPLTANVQVYSDEADPLYHSYCDFDLLPTIISAQVLSFYPSDDPMGSVAAEVFNVACRKASENRNCGKAFALSEKEETLFQSAVIYLVDIAKAKMAESIVEDKEISGAIEYMHKNISKKITISEIAADAFMSEGGFIKRFKRCVGVTPYVYLKNIRLNMAQYLKELGFTLEYISEKVGYSDAVSLKHAMKINKTDIKN